MTNRGFAITSALILTAFGASWMLTRHVYAAAPMVPFTASQSYYHIEKGVEKFSERAAVYRRDDGAEVQQRRLSTTNDPNRLLPRVITLANGDEITASDELRARSTVVSPNGGAARRRLLDQIATNDCKIGNDVISNVGTYLGKRAITLVSERTPLARDVVARLPDFNCFEVSHTYETRVSASEPWKVELGMRTTVFTAEVPRNDLFSGYEDYDEMRPVEMSRTYAKKHNVTPAQCPICYQENPILEDRYAQSHKQTR